MPITVGYEPVGAMGAAAVLAGQGQYRRYLEKIQREENDKRTQIALQQQARRDRLAQQRDYAAEQERKFQADYALQDAQLRGNRARDQSLSRTQQEENANRLAIAEANNKAKMEELKFKAGQGDRDAASTLASLVLDETPTMKAPLKEGWSYSPDVQAQIDAAQRSLQTAIAGTGKAANLKPLERVAAVTRAREQLNALEKFAQPTPQQLTIQEQAKREKSEAEIAALEQKAQDAHDEKAIVAQAKADERAEKAKEDAQRRRQEVDKEYQERKAKREDDVTKRAEKIVDRDEKRKEAEYKSWLAAAPAKGEDGKMEADSRGPEPSRESISFDQARQLAEAQIPQAVKPARLSQYEQEEAKAEALASWAAQQRQVAPVQQASNTQAEPVPVASADQHASIPSGALYTHPDGSIRRKR